jgi:hypothetical protein
MTVSKWMNDSFADSALDWLSSNGKKMYVCTTAISSASVPNYTKVTSTAALTGAITMSTSSDYTKAVGDSSGRKVTVAQKASISVTASGTGARVCLVDSTGSGTVAYVTTCTSQALTSGNTVTIPAWDVEVADPS